MGVFESVAKVFLTLDCSERKERKKEKERGGDRDREREKKAGRQGGRH